MSLSFGVCAVCDEVEPVRVYIEAQRVVARYLCSALVHKPALVRFARVQPSGAKHETFGNAITGGGGA